MLSLFLSLSLSLCPSLYLSFLSLSLSLSLSRSPSLSPPPALTLSLSLPLCLSLSLCLSLYRKKLVAPCRVRGSVVWPSYWVRGSPYPLLCSRMYMSTPSPSPCSWMYMSTPNALTRETTGYQGTVDVHYNQTLYECVSSPPYPQIQC